jgi:ubiquitin
MKLFIKSITGEINITLEVDDGDTVESVKKKIQDHEGIPPDEQRLLFRAMYIEDGRKLNDYGMKTDTTLYFLQKKVNKNV